MSDAPDFTVPDRNRDRDGAIPRFYMRAVQNNFKSQELGRPVHEEVEFVEILVPGDRKTVHDARVTEEHKRRWPNAYKAFRENRESPVEGTALDDWAGVNRGQVEELRYSHVRTVEQLAALSDDQLAKSVSMGGYALREKAQRFLEQAAGAAPAEKLAAENEVLRGNMATMQSQMDAMKAQMDRLTAQKAEAPEPPAAPL